MSTELCTCGDPECRRCYSAGYVEQGYDEDDPKHSTWAERQWDAYDNWRQEKKDRLLGEML